MRLFISINLDENTKQYLLELQNILKSQVLKGSWTRPENFHITLAFLGETPPEQLDAVKAALTFAGEAGAASPAAFSITFNHTGCWIHSRKELWWAGGFRSGGPVTILAENVRAVLKRAGINFDSRPFNAHITLGREIKHTSPLRLPPLNIAVPVRRISLMESSRAGGILTYTELSGYDLPVSEVSREKC